MNYVEQTANIGSYTQVWSVGGRTASSAVSFIVGQLGGGNVSTTDLGETSDGHIAGVSVMSIANGTVTTYSATELDYTASLYYDAASVGTLYQEGTPIRSVSSSGSGLAEGYLSAPVSAWNDYDLQTDHYAVTYIPYGLYFQNPLYYQDGSCGDASSDCTFGPGNGLYYIAVAPIYLGSTISHQTNVPQDGSLSLADSNSYSNFLQTVPKPTSPDPAVSKDEWDLVLRRVAPALFIARSAWAIQNPTNPYLYLPYLVDLIDDRQFKPSSPNNNALRLRTYLLEDTYGRPWPNSAPVHVYENLKYINGSGPMPRANNPLDPLAAGWSYNRGDGELISGKLVDQYGFQASLQPPVWFWQRYWAIGFTVPFGFPTIPVPGVNDGSIPGVGGPVVPLMIKSKDPDNPLQCKLFGSQGMLLRSDYIGINGDTGPGKPPGCFAQ